ncbi:MAG: hypothetical protein ACP5UU_06395 [Thermoprotei archaeon]
MQELSAALPVGTLLRHLRYTKRSFLSLAEDFADGEDVIAVLGDNMMFGDVGPYVSTFSGGIEKRRKFKA